MKCVECGEEAMFECMDCGTPYCEDCAGETEGFCNCYGRQNMKKIKDNTKRGKN